MKMQLLFAVAVLGLTFGNPIRADEKEDLKKAMTALKGDWKISSRTENGKETPIESIKDRVITFEEGKYTLRDGTEVFIEASFKLNLAKDPKWFDLTVTSDNEIKGKSQLGIYKIDGETLSVCIGDFDAERPTDFTAKDGSNRILAVYKKKK